MAAVEGRTGPPTYGNWRKPESAGIAGFGLLGTGLLMASIIGLVLATMLGGLLVGVAFGVLAAVALLALLVKDRHGRTGVARLARLPRTRTRYPGGVGDDRDRTRHWQPAAA